MKWFLKVLQNYANFDGRARRKEYWMFTLIFMIIYYGLIILAMTISSYIIVLVAIFALGLIVPSIAVGVRRMHDVGKSGWYILIPIYNLILACTNGEVGSNLYGPDPKAEGAEIIDHLINE